ncbi:hypothetical protein CFN78_13370 [Amycolatopsis antarctica]|uniref:HTTM-like domain-containing protein n=1 Tax=Amycolatopsis antarctica TaxID=1854586 RepID=A0A263D5F8_9PSEU|nr:hypothetical protein [Amycolatopsis antarctica]OZM72625.1 hypothetical protein CFN78_13370 [Amycolatopsis antarctica]
MAIIDIRKNRSPRPIDRREQDHALNRVEQLTGLGAAVSSLEYLASSRDFDRGELLSWETARTRYRWMSGKSEKALAAVFDKPGIQVLFGMRVFAAATLMNPRASAQSKTAAATYLAGTNFAVHARSPYGSDGSETVLTISLTTLALSRWFGADPRARQACLWFIAAQSCLSYGIAGAAKAISPVWRDGSAVRDIFRTKMFGHKLAFSVLRDRPRMARALGQVTIVGETLFPLVLVAPKPIARALIGVGAGFHVGNAVGMGLNRFVWAFLGTYPAIIYCSRALGRGKKQ